MPEKRLKSKKNIEPRAAVDAKQGKIPQKTKIARPRTFEEILRQRGGRNRVKRTVALELLKMKKAAAENHIYSSPYAYIYANYLKGIKYEKAIRAIENRLTDLGISGRIHRLSQFKNLKEIVEEDLKRGITTIVVIGDDKTAKDAIGVIAGSNIALGIIPLGGENQIAPLLGVPEGVAACDVISRRVISRLDVGQINKKIFFSRLFIAGQRTPIVCDGQYEIFSIGGDVTVFNLNTSRKTKALPSIDPKDGRFEILVKPRQPLGERIFSKKEARESLFLAKRLKIESQVVFSIYVDGQKNFYKNVSIEVMPAALKVIVGKDRQI